jgi:hypothetical protein
MNDFETIAATPRPEKPDEEKGDVKPAVEAVDWDNEPPVKEPVFASELTGDKKAEPPVEPDVIEPPVIIPPPAGEPPKKGNKKTWIIIAVVVILVLCICCAAAIAAYFIFAPSSSSYGILLPTLSSMV